MPELSLRPTLETDLQAAYERNRQAGRIPSDTTRGIGAAAADAAAAEQQRRYAQGEAGVGFDALSPATRDWARVELGNDFDEGALTKWRPYEAELGITVPHHIGELLHDSPELSPNLERLYAAKQALTASGETNPEGKNIGETMGLVLVPWQTFRDNLRDLPKLIQALRRRQGIIIKDSFDESLLAAIENNTPMYRYSESPRVLLSADHYLDRRIAQDGPVGIALIQVSNQSGLTSLLRSSANERSPDAITDMGTENFEVAGHNVGSLGIFEWLAFTLQEDPRTLSKDDYSWLLANRLNMSNGSLVPHGNWVGDQVISGMDWAGTNHRVVRPRLTVL